MMIRVYVARAWQRDKEKLNTPETAKVIRIYGAGQTADKSPSCFCATFYFASKQSRDVFVQQMEEKAGINLFSEKRECYIEKEMLKSQNKEVL